MLNQLKMVKNDKLKIMKLETGLGLVRRIAYSILETLSGQSCSNMEWARVARIPWPVKNSRNSVGERCLPNQPTAPHLLNIILLSPAPQNKKRLFQD